jgi:hypothetical protein
LSEGKTCSSFSGAQSFPHFDLLLVLHRDMGHILRIVPLVPIRELVELKKIKLSALPALQKIPPPMAFAFECVQQFELILQSALNQLRLFPVNTSRRFARKRTFLLPGRELHVATNSHYTTLPIFR